VTPRFQHALEALYGRERHKDKLGLDGTRALLAALGNPHRRFRSVHVAGTNGKGSVCAIVERVLREAGYRTGLFTSPHLVDFRERIRVDGRWVDQEWLERMLDRIAALPEGKDRTFFEVCTALGFAYFAEQGVEWAVVEVGLGGRLDSTNVLEPDVTVITSIGLDHTEILGDTIEQIAREKAGIIKAKVPVVVAPGSESTYAVIAGIAAEREAPLAVASRFETVELGDGRQGGWAPATPWGGMEVEIAMIGYFQLGNAALALQALAALASSGVAIPRQAVLDGLRAARWPGRLESSPRRPRLWWDGAHNAEGVAVLARTWLGTSMRTPGGIVLALSRDKDLSAIVRSLAALAPGGLMVATRSTSERALEPEAIAGAAREAGFRAVVARDVPSACDMALGATGTAPVLLTGSLFAVGEAMEAFGGAPGEWL
jgi:dihydrofolate synthase / folylpolyglutamate synthase